LQNERIEGKIRSVSKIVLTLATHPDKCTELPSWSVLFKSATILTVYLSVYNAIWRVCCKIPINKLEDYVEDKADDLRSYVYKKIGGKKRLYGEPLLSSMSVERTNTYEP